MCVTSSQVLEPRFNVETMAILLNIPPNKTLLRRHLATHFHLLIGAEAERLKQECLEHPDYTLLTATAKVKVNKSFISSTIHAVLLRIQITLCCLYSYYSRLAVPVTSFTWYFAIVYFNCPVHFKTRLHTQK